MSLRTRRLLVALLMASVAATISACEDKSDRVQSQMLVFVGSADQIPSDPPADHVYQLAVESEANVPDDPPDHVRYGIRVESRYELPEYWPSHIKYYLRDEMGEMQRVPRPEPPPTQTGCSAGF